MSTEGDENREWVREAARRSPIHPGRLVYKRHHQAEPQPFCGIVIREIDYTEWIEEMFDDDPEGLGLLLLQHDRDSEVDAAQWLHYEILWPDGSRTIEGAIGLRAVHP